MIKQFLTLAIFLTLALASQPTWASSNAIQGTCDGSSYLSGPGLLSISASGGTTVQLEWSSINGASGYEVRVIDASNGALVSVSYEGGLNKMVGGLQSGHNYHIGVSPIFSGNTSCDFIVGDIQIP